MPASPRAARRSWVWLLSIRSPCCWLVVVAAATDVAVLDGIGVGGGVGKEGLVETGLEDGGDRPIARCADAERVSERMCKQVSVSLPYRGDSHDERHDDYTRTTGSTAC